MIQESTNQGVLAQPSVCSGNLQDATLKLLAYCESRNWAGVDPYDALNSRIFQALPFLDRRIPRLILTQALKRNIFDVRPLLLVPGAQNPKALGLFLMSLLKLSKLGLVRGSDPIAEMFRNLELLRSSHAKYWCWGYSFPWQTRTLLVPRWAPNLVCTTFIANALLDAYEQTGQARFLEIASSSAKFILSELYWTEGESVAGFAYPLPSMRNNVHNGNLLGAALFCRVAKHTGEKEFIEPALKVARYSASRQHEDGSWDYGEAPNQHWIDNFHTGYNLDALRTIGNALETDEFDERVRRGFEFYRSHFFREDGAARYFHERTYPIDIHCVAQSIITLVNFKDLDSGNIELAHSVLNWAMNHMWDEKGFFYYRVLRTCTIRTSYMRWSQAWMLLAMSTLLAEASAGQIPAKAGAITATVQ
jgi:hypothetical protein